MVIGLTTLGGISGYLGIMLGKSDANNTTRELYPLLPPV